MILTKGDESRLQFAEVVVFRSVEGYLFVRIRRIMILEKKNYVCYKRQYF